MTSSNNSQSIIDLSCEDNISTSSSISNLLLFEKLDKIDEKTPQEITRVKDRIQAALKKGSEEFKV